MDPIMVWLILLIVFIAIEAATLGLTTIWFAGGALFAILAAVLHAPIVIQVVLFILVSLLLLFFTRPIAVKYFNKDRVRTNVESIVGRQAIVTGEINNLLGAGQVTVSGQEWSARSYDADTIIPVGTTVKILAINGVKLIVLPDVKLQHPASQQAEEASAVPRQAEEVGSVPRQAEEGSAVLRQAEEASSVSQQAEEGSSVPQKAEEVNSVPQQAEEVSSVSQKAEEVNSVPQQAEEVTPALQENTVQGMDQRYSG